MTRKITRSVARITLGLEKNLYLGNLEAKRDWGYAKEFVEAMWLMLQQDKAEDYVIATGETHSVREFIHLAFAHAGIEIEWKGHGLEEKGMIRSFSSRPLPLTSTLSIGDSIIEIDPRYFRPTEVEVLCGDTGKAKRDLGWEPKVKFKELVKIMVDADLKLFTK